MADPSPASRLERPECFRATRAPDRKGAPFDAPLYTSIAEAPAAWSAGFPARNFDWPVSASERLSPSGRLPPAGLATVLPLQPAARFAAGRSTFPPKRRANFL